MFADVLGKALCRHAVYHPTHARVFVAQYAESSDGTLAPAHKSNAIEFTQLRDTEILQYVKNVRKTFVPGKIFDQKFVQVDGMLRQMFLEIFPLRAPRVVRV